MQPQCSTPKKFYVYTLSGPKDRVFYIGKGSGRRINIHEWQARKGYTGYRHNIIRKIWAEGGQITKAIVFETDDEVEAMLEERRLIALAGPGTLANLSAGGDGYTGAVLSEEARRKHADALRGKVRGKYSPEHCRAISEGKTGRPRTQAQLDADARAKGRPLTESQRVGLANGRAKWIHLPRSEEYRAKLSKSVAESWEGRQLSDAQRAALIAKHQARKGTPLTDEHRQKISAAMRGKPKSQEARRNMAEAAKKREAAKTKDD